jgi:hypothetical protein
MTGLGVAPQVLMWGSDSPALRVEVEREYEVLLHEALARAGRAKDDACDGDGVTELAGADAGPEVVAQVMRAPRTVSRLLWPRQGERERTAQFLRKAFAVERVVRGLKPPGRFSGWTADCRAFVASSGDVSEQPVLEGGIPLDLRSPHARSLDLMGGSHTVHPARSAPSSKRAVRLSTCTEQAWQGVRASQGSVAECVGAWTRVIIVQSDGSGKFWSGSNGQYVGRVVLVNVDAANTRVEELADAIVHEATHGFLYMHECVEPWVRGYALYTDEGAIVSPWSGSLLPVRPFMQACFVWYGLAMFWAQHVSGALFDREQTRFLLGRSLVGFRNGSLADLLKPWRAEILSDIVEIIDELQRIIRSMLD